ncbi:MAG TPA: hypothetical protein VHP11_03230 [Tepidisphaeraceae bacterium]|nr:hypothetical protein [Tepidisphaeraceae bacterium]
MVVCEPLESRRFLSTTTTVTKDAVPNRDLWASDAMVGSYAQLAASDNQYQQLTELVSQKVSALDHYWRFKVSPGDRITFNVEAFHSRNNEGDHFQFAYSTDGRNFTPLFYVTKRADDGQLQSAQLPSYVQGTVYIRVQDMNRQVGLTRRDTLWIDNMFIRSQSYVPHFANGVSQGEVNSSQVTEASGLVASRKNPGVLWTHNDGGNSANVIALDTTGRRLATYHLNDVKNLNWEDIAIGSGPVAGMDYLYIADIGDNSLSRKAIVVYRIPEPTVSLDPVDKTLDLDTAVAITLRYPDKPHDAEALIFDPNSKYGGLFIITKGDNPSRIYQAPLGALTSGKAITLIDRGAIPNQTLASAADLSPDGMEVLVRYNTGDDASESVYHYTRLAKQPLWETLRTRGHRVPYIIEPNGEAIAWAADGNGYYTLSEGSDQPLYFYRRQ